MAKRFKQSTQNFFQHFFQDHRGVKISFQILSGSGKNLCTLDRAVESEMKSYDGIIQDSLSSPIIDFLVLIYLYVILSTGYVNPTFIYVLT